MRWAIIGVAAVVLAGLTVAAWLLLASPGAPGAGMPATAPSSGASAGTPSDDDDAPPASDDGSSTETTPNAGPSPDSAPVDGSEVLPPADSAAPSNRLPPLPQPTPLVEAPLPENASARGKLVDGFPAVVAGPAPGDDVLESSITSDGTTMQAALTARTDDSPDAVAEHYRATWSTLGLAPTAGETVSATDPFTSVTLAITESGTGTVYTVFATLRTE
ncbi:hypothetical protein [Microbacterium invictum]|uniref:Uncharacterized protein n=1 Tax=Microbacterium invictum TaxID=515415 RepID=A0AA40VMT1_9MICO|nr:hypothetical protein [Microbacterium invictum]MBB4140014.1 hypothetical protein [Microbacterium invictum]